MMDLTEEQRTALLAELEPRLQKLAYALWRKSPQVRLLGEVEDVLQTARCGAWEALGRYEAARVIQPGSYALWRARGAVLDAARQGALVRVPRLVQAQQPGHARWTNTIGDFAHWFGSDIEGTHEHYDISPAVELPAKLFDDEGFLDELKRQLPPRLWLVLAHAHGLEGAEFLTLPEIGQRLGVTGGWISQLHGKAVQIAREIHRSRPELLHRRQGTARGGRISQGRCRPFNAAATTDAATETAKGTEPGSAAAAQSPAA